MEHCLHCEGTSPAQKRDTCPCHACGREFPSKSYSRHQWKNRNHYGKISGTNSYMRCIACLRCDKCHRTLPDAISFNQAPNKIATGENVCNTCYVASQCSTCKQSLNSTAFSETMWAGRWRYKKLRCLNCSICKGPCKQTLPSNAFATAHDRICRSC